MATVALNFIWDATTYEAELSALDGMVFMAGLACIWEQIADLIKEASALELTYEGAQKKFADILEQVGQEVKEYPDTQSVADCMTFMDESFDSLHKFSDAFNVSPFIPVIVGMAITHHSLLTSLQVNVSHFPLKIFLLPLMSDATAVSGQMALLRYMARQSITVREGQAQSKPISRTGTGKMDPTLESDHRSNAGLIPQKLKLDQVGLTLSKKDQLEAQSRLLHCPCFHRTLHKKTLHPCHLLHPRRRNTTLLKARTPIPAAWWLPYWHSFNKASIVDCEMCHLRTHRPRILW